MKTSLKIVGLALFLSIGFNAVGANIYDTTVSVNGNSFTLANNQEIGNEVFLNSPNQHLTDFNFQYYSPTPSFAGTVGVTLRFYLNTGPTFNGYPTPAASPFYNSGLFSGLPANGFHTVSYDATDLYTAATLNLGSGSTLPTDFTFTVTFSGLSGSEQIEVPLAFPDTSGVATGLGDYWLKTGGNWSLLTNSVSSGSMVAQFSADLIPEPSVLGLGAVGGVLLMLAGKLRQRAGKLVTGE